MGFVEFTSKWHLTILRDVTLSKVMELSDLMIDVSEIIIRVVK
jgi:hypothetical protein